MFSFVIALNFPYICLRINEGVMTIKNFFSFQPGKLFWGNILAMVLVVICLLFGVLKGLDVYTRHGEAVTVPDVKGMLVGEAEKVFRNHGLVGIVSDSSYVKTLPAGCILEYNPSVGQKVKEGRIIYLTINTLDVPLCVVPDVADNSSLRQAEARILAAGFKLAEIEYMPGEKDWVYGVKYKDLQLLTGAKVPVGATLTLMVGDGGDLLNADSLGMDSITVVTKGTQTEDTSADESWF